MSVKGPVNSLPADQTGGSCFLPGSAGNAKNSQSPGTRQVFEPVVLGRQQNSYYFMARLPGSFNPELMKSSRGCPGKGESNGPTGGLEAFCSLVTASNKDNSACYPKAAFASYL